jgi:ADP-ribose pyrophosphatase
MRRVKIVKEGIVFDDFYKIEEAILQYELPNGEMTEPMQRLCHLRGDSVAGIVFNTDTQKAILVKQFRYPGYKHGVPWLVEVVAGMLKEGNDPVEEMKREVLEEVGYAVDKIEYITRCYMSPGGSSERSYIYYVEVSNASRVHEGGGLLHETQSIEVVECTLDELKEAIVKEQVPDAKSIIACNYLLAKHK